MYSRIRQWFHKLKERVSSKAHKSVRGEVPQSTVPWTVALWHCGSAALALFCAYALLTVITLSVSSCTSSPLPPVNVTRDGIAIKGYDPVAYFTDGIPVKGESRFEYVWNGAKWRFAGEEHLALFKSDPEKYAPRYGGYCAYAVSQGTTADIDPGSWAIVEGKLYLNLNKDVQGLWEKDIPGYIQKADKNWPAVLNKK